MSQVILNFHGVGPIPRNIDDGEKNCWLEQDYFEAILDMVMEHPHIRLTVDDGNLSDYEIILPALLKRNLRATFFICSGRLDDGRFLDRKMVCELFQQGMSIGSHGSSHCSWRTLPTNELIQELKLSHDVLVEVCNNSIVSAACPFGAYDSRVLTILRRVGYKYIYTSDGGFAKEFNWIQPRMTVSREMTMNYLSNMIVNGPKFSKQIIITMRSLVKRFR